MIQTDLRQTGVAVVTDNKGTVRSIPLFTNDVIYEAYSLLKEKRVKRVRKLYEFENAFELKNRDLYGPLKEDQMYKIRTGMSYDDFGKSYLK